MLRETLQLAKEIGEAWSIQPNGRFKLDLDPEEFKEFQHQMELRPGTADRIIPEQIEHVEKLQSGWIEQAGGFMRALTAGLGAVGMDESV